LTIYLLCAIGFKGGVALHQAGLGQIWLPTLAALALGTLIPLWCYPVLRLGRFSHLDAAAIAAHYGSVSAVTFIAASNFLRQIEVPFEEYSIAFLAVMESPAIVMGVLVGKWRLDPGPIAESGSLRIGMREALLSRSVILLVGTLLVGYLSGPRGLQATGGFFVDPFQGVLALFLLEMGTVAARKIDTLRRAGLFLLIFGTLMPLINGFAGVVVGHACGLSPGGATLLGVLAASASYIAAPAAIRLSLPDANPTLYLTASLAITFPFNITLGIPIYLAMARWWTQL
jgi:uncharacterized protein